MNLSTNESIHFGTLQNLEDEELDPKNVEFSVNFMSVCLIAMDVLTVIGNSTVIIAVLTVPSLQTITNYFILSLGFADFFVGIFVLPAAVVMQMNEGAWILGWFLCDAWISMDIMLCTASNLSLCAISIDRYLAISQPFRYSKRRRTKSLVFKIIAAVWILSALITCPPILGWSEPGRHDPKLKECNYNENAGYIIYSACGTFYIPLIVILYTYGRIIVVVRQRTKFFEQQEESESKLGNQSSIQQKATREKGLKLSEVILSPYLKLHFVDLSSSNEGSYSSESSSNNRGDPHNPNKCDNCGATCPSRLHVSYVNEEERKKPFLNSFRKSVRRTGVQSKNAVNGNSTSASLNNHLREAKTAKRLAVVVGFFITCWLPFFVLYVLTAFIPKSSFPVFLIDGLTWLGWVNSTLNPILYAAANPAFRKVFDGFCGGRSRDVESTVSHL